MEKDENGCWYNAFCDECGKSVKLVFHTQTQYFDGKFQDTRLIQVVHKCENKKSETFSDKEISDFLQIELYPFTIDRKPVPIEIKQFIAEWKERNKGGD